MLIDNGRSRDRDFDACAGAQFGALAGYGAGGVGMVLAASAIHGYVLHARCRTLESVVEIE